MVIKISKVMFTMGIFSLMTLATRSAFVKKDVTSRYIQHGIASGTSVRLYQTTTKSPVNDDCVSAACFRDTVTILDEGEMHLVVAKPPTVVCHHSSWTGITPKDKEYPMLQRAREAAGRKVNLVHRLDRGASGCLLLAYMDGEDDGMQRTNATALFQEAMMTEATKTYVALVRGEGILHGVDFKEKGWFTVDRPIKNERGQLKEATTFFRFVSGQSDGGDGSRPRASLVLCRPSTGRWHQIRRHLNGLSHPILGDTFHGNSRTNREWKANYGLSNQRTCLHLLRLQLPSFGVDTICPLAPDMMEMLENHLPNVLKEAEQILSEEENLSLRTPRKPPRSVDISFPP